MTPTVLWLDAERVVAVDGPPVPVGPAATDALPDALPDELPDELLGLDLAAAIGHLDASIEDEDWPVAWADRRQDALSDPGTWPSRLAEGRHEIRHLGFSTTPDAVLRALQAVAGEDPFVVPSGPLRVTWLLGAGAGVASLGALRRAGGIEDERQGGLPARLARLGLRAANAGLRVFHDAALGNGTPIDRWRPADIEALIDHRWKATRPGPIRLARWWPPARDAGVRWPSARVPRFTRPRIDRPESGRPEIDVVIPTLERPEPLHDVLRDLATQTLVPQRVVVVEQIAGGGSRLDASRAETWPFTLDIVTLERLGASHARNVALLRCRAPWTALLDDDVRLAPDLLARWHDLAVASGADALSIAEVSPVEARPVEGDPVEGDPVEGDPVEGDPVEGDPVEGDPVEGASELGTRLARPVLGLGSGRCLARHEALLQVGGFDEVIEGWGEDVELALRLHHAGQVVLATDALHLVHLKAPRGGFRAGHSPPSSPLIVYRWLRHCPESMLHGLIRSHLMRGARGRRSGLVSLPFRWPLEWLRLRRSRRVAARLIEAGPRLIDSGGSGSSPGDGS